MPAADRAEIKYIEKNSLCGHAADLGEYTIRALEEWKRASNTDCPFNAPGDLATNLDKTTFRQVLTK